MTHSVVIGGSGGLGSAVRAAFAARGDAVTALSRSSDMPCDLTEPRQIWAALNAVTLGKVPINNIVFAQRDRSQGVRGMGGELHVGPIGTHNFIDAAVERFACDGSRSIVIVTSTDDTQVREQQSEGYHVAKAGLLHLMRYQAVKLAPLGIRCNAVAPGTFLSDRNRTEAEGKPLTNLIAKITPLSRVGTAADVAAAVLWLCSEQASFITGQRICVDGGLSLLAPEAVARKLMNI